MKRSKRVFLPKYNTVIDDDIETRYFILLNDVLYELKKVESEN